MEQVLTASNISKSFTTGTEVHHALKEVSLTVTKGEIVMLMGPSGSGKTTLLSIMGGILSPTSGEISIAGEPMTNVSATEKSRLRLAHIGFIFQEYNLFPSLSALQNVLVALDLRGVSGRKAKQEAITQLNNVGLGDKLNNHPAKLSGGQKQRLAIARALAGNPNLLLADEPTAALDSQNGLNVMELLRTMAHTQNRAVVIVTHDNRITEFADRILRIEDGRLHEPPAHPMRRASDLAGPEEQTEQTPPNSASSGSHQANQHSQTESSDSIKTETLQNHTSDKSTATPSTSATNKPSAAMPPTLPPYSGSEGE